MAKVYFRYSAMNASKSAALMMVAFNYAERGMRTVILKPTVDTKSSKVVSRIGIEKDVDWSVSPQDSILDFFHQDEITLTSKLECIIVDEAQFLTPEQVDELFEIAVLHDTPVIAYGLRGDFKTHAFPGALRLLEISHHLEEIKTICRCGKKALFNGRKINGEFVQEGKLVAIDDNSDGVSYESVCGECYFLKVGKPIAL